MRLTLILLALLATSCGNERVTFSSDSNQIAITNKGANLSLVGNTESWMRPVNFVIDDQPALDAIAQFRELVPELADYIVTVGVSNGDIFLEGDLSPLAAILFIANEVNASIDVDTTGTKLVITAKD